MGVLDGKVAIVTGAGRGLGRSHALAMAQEGAKIVVNDIGVEWDGTGQAKGPADDVVKEIKDAGGDAVACFDSVVDFQGAKNIIDTAINSFGKLNILVNNAGFLRDKMSFNMSEEEWDAVVDVHLKGTFNCGRWAAAYFREQSKAGVEENRRIINTVSHAGLIGNPGQGNYGAAKAGIACLTLIWAREFQRFNATVNSITPMARTRMTTMTGYFTEIPGEGQFDEFAPENISPLVVYLASDAAQDITGQVLSIRGGKLEVFRGWYLDNSIDIQKRWSISDLQQRIRELGDLSLPEMVF